MDSVVYKLEGVSWQSYMANKPIVDEIISDLLIDDGDRISDTVAILPKSLSKYFPNSDDWFITRNNINDIVQYGTTLLWLADRMEEKLENR